MLINKGYLNLIITENRNQQSQSQIQTKNLQNSLKFSQTFFHFSIEILDSFCLCLCWSSFTGVIEDLFEAKVWKSLKIATVEAWACSWHFEISSSLSTVELKPCFHSPSATSLNICFYHWSFESNRIKICIFKR